LILSKGQDEAELDIAKQRVKEITSGFELFAKEWELI